MLGATMVVATLPVSDLERSRAFYGETLGLPFLKTWGQMPASEFQAGNLTLAVMQSDAFGIEFAPSSSMVALAVDDVAAVRERLEGEGIEFRGQILDSIRADLDKVLRPVLVTGWKLVHHEKQTAPRCIYFKATYFFWRLNALSILLVSAIQNYPSTLTRAI